MRKHFLLYANNSTTNEISKLFLTVVHIVINNCCNNGDIHSSLKCYIQNFKTSLKKYKNIKSTYSIKKFKGRKKGRQYLIISFNSKDIPAFKELVIKNTLVKR